MFELLIIVGLVVGIAVLAIVIMLLLNSLGAYFVELDKGTTTFITAGKTPVEILPNVDGHKMSEGVDPEGQYWLISAKSEDDRIAALFRNSMSGTAGFQKWLWKRFGVKFISPYWPQTRVHKFDIGKDGRHRLAARGKSMPLSERVIDSPLSKKEGSVVNSLRFIVPRPMYMEGVELGGGDSKVNLVLLPVFQQVIPSLPVFNLMGEFFPLLDASVETAVMDGLATHIVHEKQDDGTVKKIPLTFHHWLKLAKSGGESLFEPYLRTINANKSYRKELEELHSKNMVANKNLPKNSELVDYLDKITHNELAKEATSEELKIAPGGIIKRFGFALISIRLVEWEPHEDSKELAKAFMAKETQAHTAEGVRKEAEGKRDAIEAVAKAESSRYERLVSALVNKGVTPDVAAGVVQTQLRTENIGGKDSKVVTYVEGGSLASVMVNASSPTSTK